MSETENSIKKSEFGKRLQQIDLGLDALNDAMRPQIMKIADDARKELVTILKRQHDEGVRDANERLKWFIRWFNPKELEIDEDGFVKWIRS